MAVDGFEVVGMAYNHIFAISAALVVDYPHTAVEGCAHGIADIELEVYAFVHAAEAAPVAVGRGYVARVRH